MGEDIHFRAYLKRRQDGKYVNAHEVCEWNPDNTSFEEPFSGRNYDVFSLFGSGRGNYAPLPEAQYGMPEFLVGTDFDKYCKECGFYGFVWFKVRDLEHALERFIARLLDPLKYYGEDSDEYRIWKELRSPGKKSAAQMKKLHDMYTEWYDEHSTMLYLANEMYEKIRHFTSAYCPPQDQSQQDPYGRSYEETLYYKMFDTEETVFLFFFDC